MLTVLFRIWKNFGTGILCRLHFSAGHLHAKIVLQYVNVVVLLALQAVDVVGQAGNPKTITGFQTHTTPVLLAYGERAELATEECILLFNLNAVMISDR